MQSAVGGDYVRTPIRSESERLPENNDVTRRDPAGRKISFSSFESTMYRCRRDLQPKIPHTLSELDIQLLETIFGMRFKASVFRGDDS